MVVSLNERLHSFSFEDYVEIAERSPIRVEFWEGTILDMSGGSPRHSAICNNVAGILREQLRGKPCRAFDANLRIRSVPANRSTYADVTVVRGELERDPQDKTRQTVLNPTVLIEVQSPTTASDDRGPKLDGYKLIGSVRAVVLITQDRAEVTVHERRADGSWVQTTHHDGAFEIAAIGCKLPLSEIYEDLPEA